jgi:hypothetical protein
MAAHDVGEPCPVIRELVVEVGDAGRVPPARDSDTVEDYLAFIASVAPLKRA